MSSDKVNYSQSGEFLGHEKEVYFTLRFDKLAYEDFGFESSLCFQSDCFDPKLPIQHYKNRYYQRQSFPEKEEEYHFLYNSQLRLFLKRESQYGEGKFSWEQLGAVHFKGSSESFCSPTTLKQQILQGKEKLNFPQELTFFGEKYQLQDLDFEINYGLDARNDFGFTKKYEQLFVNAEEAEKVISEDIQKDLLIYGNYIFSFPDAPQVKLNYSNLRFPQTPQALYFSKAELQLNQSGDLISLPQTRQLYCDLRLEDRNQTICGKREREEPKTLEGAMIFEEEKEKKIDRSSAKNSRERDMLFTPALLPLFRLQKTNIPHYYFIFPAE